MKDDKLLQLTERLASRYAGKYVIVVDGRVLSSGRNQLSAYKRAEKNIPKGTKIGIFYVPAKNALPLLLKIR